MKRFLIVIVPLLFGCAMKQTENAKRQCAVEFGVQTKTNSPPGPGTGPRVKDAGNGPSGNYAAAADGVSPMPKLRNDVAHIRCFFLANDGLGHHGYAAQDSRSSKYTVDPSYMWPTLQDLRREIEKISPTPEIHTFLGEETGGVGGNAPAEPPGWRIRGLTQKEVEYLTPRHGKTAK